MSLITLATVLVSAGCGFFGPTVRRPQEVCLRERTSTASAAGTSDRHRFELQVPYHVSGRNPHNNFQKFAADHNYWLYLDAREGRVVASSLVLSEHRDVLLANQAVSGYVEIGATVVTIRLHVREHYWDSSSPARPWDFNGTFPLRPGEGCSSTVP